MTDPKNLPKHPHGDTSANESKDGKPPPTWNPVKVTQESAVEKQDLYTNENDG